MVSPAFVEVVYIVPITVNVLLDKWLSRAIFGSG